MSGATRTLAIATTEVGLGGGEHILADLVGAAVEAGMEPTGYVPQRSPLAAQPWARPYERWPGDAADADVVVANSFSALRHSTRLRVARRHRPVKFICHGAWETTLKKRAFLRLLGAEVFCVSEQVRREVCRAGVVDRSRVSLLPYAPPVPAIPGRAEARRLLGVPVDAFLAGFVGRLHPVKRPEVFVEAVERARVSGAMAVSQTFGTAEEEVAERALRGALRSSGHVRCRWDGRADLVLAAADVLVSTSTRESLGIAIMEGMQLGMPVLVTAEDGPADYLAADGAGIWLPGAGASEVASALTRLAGDQDLRSRLGGANRAALRGRSPRLALQAIVGGYRGLDRS